MSRPTSATTTSSTIASEGPTRNLSVKASVRPPQNNNNPLPISDAKLFVTNLRLLNLDQQPDWPNITVQSLSSRNADQKQRISGVEWALFRLFEIWNPEDTNQVGNSFDLAYCTCSLFRRNFGPSFRLSSLYSH